MKPQTRQKFIAFHVILAGFFLPAALTFAITGGLYTFGIKGNYNTQILQIPLKLPELPSLGEATMAAEKILVTEGHQKFPSGSASLRKTGLSWQFDWSGVQYDFTLEPTVERGIYTASIKRTTFHRFFVQLHKAKGGTPFKILAGGLALAFILLFASGVMMSFSNPTLKKKMFISLPLGTITFVFAALLS